jgi:hypothetical protein
LYYSALPRRTRLCELTSCKCRCLTSGQNGFRREVQKMRGWLFLWLSTWTAIPFHP